MEMKYAVQWIETDGVKNILRGWTIHDTLEQARNAQHIEEVGEAKRSGNVYAVEVPDDREFKKRVLASIMRHGYFFTPEREPRWLRGSNSPQSKLNF